MAVYTLRSEQNGQHFADDIFEYIFLNEKYLASLDFHWSLIPKSNWQKVTPGYGKHLVPR